MLRVGEKKDTNIFNTGVLNGSCECVCMSECVLIYFLSFAQLEKKKNEQAEKKDCYHGSAEAFFF